MSLNKQKLLSLGHIIFTSMLSVNKNRSIHEILNYLVEI